MRPQTAFVLLAWAAQTLAQDPDFDIINQPAKDEDVPAGETYTIEWALGSSALTGPATITLLGGADSNTLESLGVIGHVNNEALKFSWDVDASLGTDNLYGISIALDADTTHFQYSPGFHIVATNSTSASTSAAAGAASSTASSTATSAASSAASSAAASSTASSAASSSSVISSAPATTNSTTSVASSTSLVVTSSIASANATTLSTASATATITTKASSSASTATKTATSSAASATSTLVTSGSEGRHLTSAVPGAVLASFVGSVALHLLYL